VLVTRDVVVYGKPTARVPPPDPFTTVTYYACGRPRGPSVELGVYGFYDGREFDATIDHLRSAGTYVAGQATSGQARNDECNKYTTTGDCPPADAWISVVDTKTLRHVHVPRSGDGVSVTVSPRGAIAWLEYPYMGAPTWGLEATALHPHGRTGFTASPAVIDTGQIDPGSLRFVSRTLHWTRDKHPHEQTLT
jgi:hypothetical protein